jgi:hypothetical protein
MVFAELYKFRELFSGFVGRDVRSGHECKTKAVSDAEEEEDPVPVTFPEIKAEPEMSCMCTVKQIIQICR